MDQHLQRSDQPRSSADTGRKPRRFPVKVRTTFVRIPRPLLRPAAAEASSC